MLFADYFGDQALARAYEAAARTEAQSNEQVAMIIGAAVVIAAVVFGAVLLLRKKV